MKHAPLLLVPLLFGAALAAQATSATRTPLRPQADCPRIDRINEWHVVDARTVTVRTGPHRYVVRLEANCPRLGVGNPGLLFRTSNANQVLGDSRICGDVGETVRARDQPPCAIASVREVDKAHFDKLTRKSRHSGSGADQPTRP